MGILDKVLKASEIDKQKIKALVYGANGSGKTTLCGTMPGERRLFATNEQQGEQAALRVDSNLDVLRIRSADDIRELLKELRGKDHGYDSLALDSLTEMQILLAEEIMAKKPETTNGKPKKLSMEDFMFLHDRTRSLVRAFRDLDLHILVTCLSTRAIVGEGDAAKIVVQPMLIGQKLPAQLGQFFNIMGFVYRIANEDGTVAHRVLFEGRRDRDTKGMPGLCYQEIPDVAYWYARAYENAEPGRPDETMIAPPSVRG